jgi:hypothetical protein
LLHEAHVDAPMARFVILAGIFQISISIIQRIISHIKDLNVTVLEIIIFQMIWSYTDIHSRRSLHPATIIMA